MKVWATNFFTWLLLDINFKAFPSVDDLEGFFFFVGYWQWFGTEVAVIDDVTGTDVDGRLGVASGVWEMYSPRVWSYKVNKTLNVRYVNVIEQKEMIKLICSMNNHEVMNQTDVYCQKKYK